MADSNPMDRFARDLQEEDREVKAVRDRHRKARAEVWRQLLRTLDDQFTIHKPDKLVDVFEARLRDELALSKPLRREVPLATAWAVLRALAEDAQTRHLLTRHVYDPSSDNVMTDPDIGRLLALQKKGRKKSKP